MFYAETQKKALITQCIYREAEGRLKTADNLLHMHYLMNAFVQRILLYNKIVISSMGNEKMRHTSFGGIIYEALQTSNQRNLYGIFLKFCKGIFVPDYNAIEPVIPRS